MLDLSTWEQRVHKRHEESAVPPGGSGAAPVVPMPVVMQPAPTQDAMRKCAWQIGEAKPAEKFQPAGNHVSLSMVNPRQGFAHWRIRPEWIEKVSREKGGAWNNCRLVIRLYDTTNIEFNGLNAHHIQSMTLPNICGHFLFGFNRPGSNQLAEVGFELRNGEFIPAARSQFTRFAPEGVSGRSDHSALHVDAKLKSHAVPNLWEKDAFLKEKRRPKLKKSLRIATLAYESAALGHTGKLATFVAELAANTAKCGHEVHVFAPGSEKLSELRVCDGVTYHPLDVEVSALPTDTALNFAKAAEASVNALPAFDLFHIHDWMAGLAPWIGTRPTILSLTSTEKARLNGAEPTPLSVEISKIEHELMQVVECVLTPDWLREKLIAEFGADGNRVRAFPVEGRMLNEWDRPLDLGAVKSEFGVPGGAKLLLYVGPLEHHAGVDLLVEALPIILHRHPSACIGFVGLGGMHDHLLRRAHQIGAGHAVRMFGHMDGSALTRLLRASDALILPSRNRVAGDDAVVDLARRAGKAVVTTHGGPAYLIRHEQTGIITYDNPGSMVWAMDRVFGDGAHTARMGETGRRTDGAGYSWAEVAKLYGDICAECFPELTEVRD